MYKPGVLIVGGGLAGLSCAVELSSSGYPVLLIEGRAVLGGRTSSWVQDGMLVESGLHRVLGFYRAFPELLTKAGINLNDIVYWEDEVEIRKPDGGGAGVFGASPLFNPLETGWGVFRNLDLLTPVDWLSLSAFFGVGLAEYFANPGALDRRNVREMAQSLGVTKNKIHTLLIPLTSGLYFLPPENYSAYVFFGTFGAFLSTLPLARVGAFLGGMTEVLADPIAAFVARKGGEVRTGSPATRLIMKDGRVTGVDTPSGPIEADHVVLATSLAPAQRLLSPAFEHHSWFQAMLRLPSMPSVTIQMELTSPALPIDRTTFGPDTALASFAEQSRTTFRGKPGRFSIILTPPEKFLGRDAGEVFDITCLDAERLGIRLRDRVSRYRVIELPEDFYSLSPGTDKLRPCQQTPVPGLTLAGDYTQQQYLATMEGAVVSGKRAADAAASDLKNHQRQTAR